MIEITFHIKNDVLCNRRGPGNLTKTKHLLAAAHTCASQVNCAHYCLYYIYHGRLWLYATLGCHINLRSIQKHTRIKQQWASHDLDHFQSPAILGCHTMWRGPVLPCDRWHDPNVEGDLTMAKHLLATAHSMCSCQQMNWAHDYLYQVHHAIMMSLGLWGFICVASATQMWALLLINQSNEVLRWRQHVCLIETCTT
jgi:hypothetical protein